MVTGVGRDDHPLSRTVGTRNNTEDFRDTGKDIFDFFQMVFGYPLWMKGEFNRPDAAFSSLFRGIDFLGYDLHYCHPLLPLL